MPPPAQFVPSVLLMRQRDLLKVSKEPNKTHCKNQQLLWSLWVVVLWLLGHVASQPRPDFLHVKTGLVVLEYIPLSCNRSHPVLGVPVEIVLTFSWDCDCCYLCPLTLQSPFPVPFIPIVPLLYMFQCTLCIQWNSASVPMPRIQ